MAEEYLLIGFGLQILGALVFTIVAISGLWHQKKYTNPWTKRYWWHSWRPIYKNTKTLKWKINLKRIVIVEGFIPPKHKLNWLGFIFILIGIIFQVLTVIK